jgi:hypothetical protein
MTEPKRDSLAAALLAFQAEAPKIQKDKLNPAFRSKYASLDAILTEVMPTLNKHGLVWSTFPCIANDQPALRYELSHPASGESVGDTMLLMLAKNEPQGQGSGLTYARRYSFLGVLNLTADEDDDGQAARTNGQGARVSRAASTPTFNAPVPKEQREQREALLEEFKGLQATLARSNRAWTKTAILSACGAAAGETFKDFDELPHEAIAQWVDVGRGLVKEGMAS